MKALDEAFYGSDVEDIWHGSAVSVGEFMRTSEQPIHEEDPSAINALVLLNRIRMLKEEIFELFDALLDEDIVEVADAVTDIHYVAVGGYLELGSETKVLSPRNRGTIPDNVGLSEMGEYLEFWYESYNVLGEIDSPLELLTYNYLNLAEEIANYAGVTLHLPVSELFDEVQRSNMSKFVWDEESQSFKALKDDFGKTQKGPNYFKPNITKVLGIASDW